MKRRRRLKRNQLDGRIEFPQTARCSHKRAARSQPRDKMRQRARGLLDDLRSGRIVVRAPVAVVVVLIGIEVLVGILRKQTPRLPNGAVGTLERARHDQIRAKGPKDELAFVAGILRHAQLDLVPLCRPDHRVRDPGVAGRRIENRLAMPELARGLTLRDHSRRRAILDGPPGVLPLSLGVNLDAGTLLLDLTEPNEWSAANEVENGHTDAGYDGAGYHALYLRLIQSDIII